jgi:hypothetical protein
VAVILLAFVAVGAGLATVAPAATITIQAATDEVGPLQYELTFRDALVEGTVREAVSGTASGTYTYRETASGIVTFRNWTPFEVQVPQNAEVAAGEVGFATTAAIAVPPGDLTPGGFIRAGEADAPVVAIEPGSSGNVPAEAIDTVRDPGLAFELRGFLSLTEDVVVNREATVGGLEEERPEITERDVEQVVGRLQERLERARADELGDAGEAIVAEPDEPLEPQIEVPDDLIGTRDTEEFTVEGSLRYARASVPSADVDARAIKRLEDDGAAIPEGWTLIPDTARISLGESRIDGRALVVELEVTAVSTPRIDADALRADLLGRPKDEAQSVLAPLGTVTVDTWPGWVDSVPSLDWRVEINVIEPDPQLESPASTAEPEPSPT